MKKLCENFRISQDFKFLLKELTISQGVMVKKYSSKLKAIIGIEITFCTPESKKLPVRINSGSLFDFDFQL